MRWAMIWFCRIVAACGAFLGIVVTLKAVLDLIVQLGANTAWNERTTALFALTIVSLGAGLFIAACGAVAIWRMRNALPSGKSAS